MRGDIVTPTDVSVPDTTRVSVDASLPQRSFAQRLGGRWLVSREGFVIGALLTLATFTSHLSVSPNADAQRLFAYWLVGALWAGGVSVGAHRTVLRNRARQPVSVSMAGVYLLVAIVPAAIVYEFGRQAAGISTERSVASRAIELAMLALLASGALIVALDSLSELKVRRDELIERRIQTVLLEHSRRGYYREVEQQLRSQIHSSIEAVDPGLMSEIDVSSAETLLPSTSRVVRALQQVSDYVVQPFSRRLWQVSIDSYPRIGMRDFVRTLIWRQPFATAVLVTLTLLTNYGPTIDDVGLVRGVAYLAAMGMIVWVVCGSANAMMRRFPGWHIAIFGATFIVLQASTHLSNTLRPSLGLQSVPAGYLAVQATWSAVFIGATTAFGALRRVRVENLARFAAVVDEERVAAMALSRKVAEHARETARLLHGAMQTRLAVCGLTIEKAQQSNDEAALGLALMEAVAILQTPVTPPVVADSVSAEVHRKVSLWKGFCDTVVTIDPSMAKVPSPALADASSNTVAKVPSPALVRDIGRVVEEGISNAIRHAGASRIDISVTAEASGGVLVVIKDNGSGFDDARPGVGSAMIDQITNGNWSLTCSDGVTQLEARVPNDAATTGC